jgi:hypothetical protein
MHPGEESGLALQASDVSMQKIVNVRNVPRDASIGELVQGLLDSLKLPANDAAGRPLSYHARLEREGRHLHASEKVGVALQTGDQVILQPNVDAGRGRR